MGFAVSQSQNHETEHETVDLGQRSNSLITNTITVSKNLPLSGTQSPYDATVPYALLQGVVGGGIPFFPTSHH